MFRLRTLVLISTIAFAPLLMGQERMSGGPSDTEITTRVKAALIADERAKARDIDVETDRGVVQLSGFVESEDAKEAAEKAAASVNGVEDVRNELVVRRSGDQKGDRTAGAVVDDSVIAAKVKAELAEDEGLATASNVNVEVRSGVVQLSGFVASAEEKSRAASIANNVEGVQDVRNDIAVRRR